VTKADEAGKDGPGPQAAPTTASPAQAHAAVAAAFRGRSSRPSSTGLPRGSRNGPAPGC